MIQLNKDLISSKTLLQNNQSNVQIDATDKQIDKLVYELHGPSDEEIKIVEDSLN